jgi:hypothetical protein
MSPQNKAATSGSKRARVRSVRSVRSVRVRDERLTLIRRRQEIDVRFGGPRCAVDGDSSGFTFRPSDVVILDVMAREVDPHNGGVGPRTAFAALAQVESLGSAETLIRAVEDGSVHPGLRANALVALQRMSPALAGSLAGHLMADGDTVVRQAAAGALRRLQADGPSGARVRSAKRTPTADQA